MDDRFTKYSKLTGAILVLFAGFLISIAILLLVAKLLFGLFDHVPFFAYLFAGFVVAAPSLLFLSVFSIFFLRTRRHPSSFARWFSYLIFSVAMLLWLYALGSDAVTFFQKFYPDANKYFSYQFWMLVGSVLAIFLTGLVQAMTTVDEKDWLEKRKEKESGRG